MHAAALRNLAKAFPADRLPVRHYESKRQNLLRSFFEAVGVSSPQLAPLAGTIGLLNRSLTRDERDLRLHRTALNIVMQKVVTAVQDHHNWPSWRSENLDRQNLATPDLPKDFEPAAYLLLNQDMIPTHIPLVRHFLDHGRREGRAHSWIPKKKI